MSQQPHPSQSVLTVDLGAIVANYRLLRSRLNGAECAVVVKADAYGLGALRVAPALAAAGARHFFVADLGEALEIRGALPAEARIYVLNGMLHGEADEFRARNLIPALNDLGQIAAWSLEARRSGAKLPAIVHFDTGMSRLGLTDDEADRLIAEPRYLEHIELGLVMSHLACADEPGHPLNAAQLKAFAARRRAFAGVAASLVNSSGIFLGAEYHFDLARPGCALYGINPVPGHPNPVGQVARLSGKILQIRDVDPPRTVGYGATHRVAATTRVATIAAGYADGWLRSLSNRGSAYFGDVRVPIIGRVSMDLITLDVTATPQIRVGDTVELMGDRLTVDDVATKAGTIGYEVLTRLGRRFARVYVDLPAST